MNLAFSSDDPPQPERHAAWREALCEHFGNARTMYDGVPDRTAFIKKASFGELTMVDCELFPQRILRAASHPACTEKDNCHLVLPRKGQQLVEQRGRTIVCGRDRAVLFSASEPYVLSNHAAFRATYLAFAVPVLAGSAWRPPSALPRSLNTSFGLGRVLMDCCSSMTLECLALSDEARASLGKHVLDLLGLAFKPLEAGRQSSLDDDAPPSARLRQVKAFVEENIGNPLLNPERIARANRMSVRSLHYLFKQVGESVSGYIWNRRLERCRAELELRTGGERSIADIAQANGFNSTSHFSSTFRRRFGMTPTVLRSAASG